MKITKCTGEGQGSCKRCSDNGKWNRMWMCFLYKIEGYEGCYCGECVKEIQHQLNKKGKTEMKYENVVEVVSNYATCQLPKVLEHYGQNGFRLVNAVIAKNKYNCDVMYLFFTKQKDGVEE